ncbi:hypothetical protein WICMUC_002938 [Wickerhamomyces mucosus]|uniref:CCHC-type domain-containing protein n=1 Tax=Wickerhamomyces mucosus TaxID=1378264 RepID=A0A9P8PN69_9ASCO|nr:hypothetical protein WICMUC_002938 [Wickerhamomyces mucosus]
MDNRLIILQQVMSSPGPLAQWAEDRKLSGQGNYSDWNDIFRQKLRARGLGLFEFLDTGNYVFAGANDDAIAVFNDVCHSIIDNMLFTSAHAKIFDTVGTRGLHGQVLYQYLAQSYGQITPFSQFSIISKVYASANYDDVDSAVSVYSKIREIYPGSGPDAAEALSFLHFLSLGRYDESQIKEILNAQTFSGAPLTFDSVVNIARNLLPNTLPKSLPSTISTTAFSAKEAKTCFNCFKKGHFARQCPLPKTEEYKLRLAELRLKRATGKSKTENASATEPPAWFVA